MLAAMDSTQPMAVSMEGIKKRFGSVAACDSIDLDVQPGEIHALLGENGAGKTTLMTILYGLRQPDAGKILVDGESVKFHSPADAMRRGIGMVQQNFALVPTLTVIENCALGREPYYRRLSLLRIRKQLERVAAEYGLTLDPTARVADLPVALQQRVEIVKALTEGVQLLILDEPTAVLTPSEVEELFLGLRNFTEKGNSVILITHKLAEVARFTQRITVLRQGKLIRTLPTQEATNQQLAELMTGSSEIRTTVRTARVSGEVLLAVRELDVMGDRGNLSVRGVAFELRSGEILGIAGVEENGQSELVQALTGLRDIAGGSIQLGGREVSGWGPKRLMRAGIGHVPEDRERWGLFDHLTIGDNLVAETYTDPPFARLGMMVRRAVANYARMIIDRFTILPRQVNAMVENMSGGNRQRLLVGRVFTREPKVLVVSQPTRGLDLAATYFIRQRLVSQRDRGAGILLVSADLEEVLELSDRVAVMLNGRLVAIMDGGEATRERIGPMMAGVAAS